MTLTCPCARVCLEINHVQKFLSTDRDHLLKWQVLQAPAHIIPVRVVPTWSWGFALEANTLFFLLCTLASSSTFYKERDSQNEDSPWF